MECDNITLILYDGLVSNEESHALKPFTYQ